MAILRKKAQLQVINASAKLASADTGLQRIPSEPEFPTDVADHCRVALDGPHAHCRATGALPGNERVATSAVFPCESAARPAPDASESSCLLVETHDCYKNCDPASTGSSAQRHGFAVEMTSVTLAVQQRPVVCVENDAHFMRAISETVGFEDRTPGNSSSDSNNSNSVSNSSRSRNNVRNNNSNSSNSSSSSSSSNNSSSSCDGNAWAGNGCASNGRDSNGCDSIGVTTGASSCDDEDGREARVRQIDELKEGDSMV